MTAPHQRSVRELLAAQRVAPDALADLERQLYGHVQDAIDFDADLAATARSGMLVLQRVARGRQLPAQAASR